MRFFDAIAGRYERAYALPAAESRRRMDRVLRELPRPPGRVLDLGVGTGRELSPLLDAGYLPTGLDVSRAMLERCARRARPVPLVEANFWEGLPFADARFDAAVALYGTLAHPPDDEAMGRLARELSRVVRTGGSWVTEVPAPAWLDELDRARPPDDAERRVRRTGASTCVCEDQVAGVSLGARVLSEGEWRAALGADWSARIEGQGETEWFIVAHRL